MSRLAEQVLHGDHDLSVLLLLLVIVRHLVLVLVLQLLVLIVQLLDLFTDGVHFSGELELLMHNLLLDTVDLPGEEVFLRVDLDPLLLELMVVLLQDLVSVDKTLDALVMVLFPRLVVVFRAEVVLHLDQELFVDTVLLQSVLKTLQFLLLAGLLLL